MANINQWKHVTRIESYRQPVNGIVQPSVIPPKNRPGRLTTVLESLRFVLNAISLKRWAIHFRDPFDSTALGVPDYHTVLKRPMDLTTIRKRLTNKYYYQGSEAIEDFTLIFENCLRFHKEGTVVHQAGEKLKAFFHKSLAYINFINEVDLEEELSLRLSPSHRRPGGKRRPRRRLLQVVGASLPTCTSPGLKNSFLETKLNPNLPSLWTATIINHPSPSPTQSPPPPPQSKPLGEKLDFLIYEETSSKKNGI